MMHKHFFTITLSAIAVSLFVACSDPVNVDPNMKQFMEVISKTAGMSEAITKFGEDPDMETDLDWYELKDPQVISLSDKDGLKCYVMNVKHGIINSNCEVCWKKDKISSLTVIYN